LFQFQRHASIASPRIRRQVEIEEDVRRLSFTRQPNEFRRRFAAPYDKLRSARAQRSIERAQIGRQPRHAPRPDSLGAQQHRIDHKCRDHFALPDRFRQRRVVGQSQISPEPNYRACHFSNLPCQPFTYWSLIICHLSLFIVHCSSMTFCSLRISG
jgi:hypothetical protein